MIASQHSVFQTVPANISKDVSFFLFFLPLLLLIFCFFPFMLMILFLLLSAIRCIVPLFLWSSQLFQGPGNLKNGNLIKFLAHDHEAYG